MTGETYLLRDMAARGAQSARRATRERLECIPRFDSTSLPVVLPKPLRVNLFLDVNLAEVVFVAEYLGWATVHEVMLVITGARGRNRAAYCSQSGLYPRSWAT